MTPNITPRHHPTFRRQRGAATLLITMMLLFAVTLAVMFSSQTTVMEVRMSSNELRAKQAHAAAQAGIDFAIALFNTRSGPKKADGSLFTAAEVAGAATLDDGSTYSVRFCALDAVLSADCTCVGDPAAETEALIFACGRSDDDTAQMRLSQGIKTFRAIPDGNGPDSPLISRGSANVLGGTATIINYYTNMTVWTGESVAGQANTSTTLIRDSSHDIPQMQPSDPNDPSSPLVWPSPPSPGNSPSCNNPPAGYVCTSQGSDFGPDVIHSDTRLSEQLANHDAYFQNFFGTSFSLYKESMSSSNVYGGVTKDSDINTLVKGANGEGQVHWIEGDTTIGGGGQIGSPENPVVLIIEGNLNLVSNVVIYGVVYASGNMTGSGTPTIYGSLVVAGSTSPSGTLKIIFDPNVIGRASSNTGGRKGGTIPGSWRDWI